MAFLIQLLNRIFVYMPTVFETNGYRFFFYSNENNEPIHIHVGKSINKGIREAEAKYWIKPSIDEVYSYGFKANERKEIKILIKENADKIIKKWTEHFK